MRNSKLILKALSLSICAFPMMILHGQLKEEFTPQDRLHLLKMATFGPTGQMVSDVNNTNSNIDVADEIEWLDYQLNHPSAYDDPDDDWLSHFQRVEQIATTLEPTVDFYQDYPNEDRKSQADGHRIFNRFAPGTSSYNIDAFQMSAWWDNALGNVDLNDKLGSDQLRQRMAYALSQLLVVSKAAFPLNGRTEGLAFYYDILAENAFGNYETLLQNVLRSPAMGVFLSSAMNQKASLAKNTRPDENLAREFMQLFTIGPYELEVDGRRKADTDGKSIPSYTQNDIIEMAKVLTGWNLFLYPNWNRLGKNSGSYQHLMEFHPEKHEDELDEFYADDPDRGTITLFKNKAWATSIELNATDELIDGSGSVTHSGLDAAIKIIFNHPNVGPFVSRHLIKHFVTSNPTPAYVSRIATVFNDDGNGVRGNLKAVLRAILLDQEAYNQSIEVGGRVKEPLLVLTQFLRAMEVRPWPKTKSIMLLDDSNPKYLQKMYSFRFPEDTINQAALRAFDVFNFYDRDFMPPDQDVMMNGLTSQESEIINDNFFPNFQNQLDLIIKNYKNFRLKCSDPSNLTGLNDAPEMNYYWPNFMIDLEKPLSILIKGLGKESGLLTDVNGSDFNDDEVFAEAVNDLLDWYETNLLFARFNANFRSAFVELCVHGLNHLPSINSVDNGQNVALNILENSLFLLISSPDFMVEAGTVPDITPPELQILGSPTIQLKIGDTYVEEGYRASDNVFGDMQSRVTITGDVNTSKAGTYDIIYSVVDIAGNVSESVKRTVVISGEVTENPITYWWSNSSNVGNGFYQSWLGYFMPFDSGWIYHTDLGWVYVVRNDTVGLWLWTQVNGWTWASEESWPFLWSNQTGGWLYLIVVQGQPYFFDYSRNAFLK